MELHQSTLKTAETCLRKYKYRYVEGLDNDTPIQVLLLGTAFHKGAEWYYEDRDTNPLDHFSKLKRRFSELSEDNKEILGGMLQSYGIFARKNDPQLIDEVIAIEYHFEVPVVDAEGQETEHTLAGTVDLVFRDPQGNLCFLDHKTRTRLKDDEDYLKIDNQMLMYDYALSREFDERVEACYYNTILKKVPSTPRVLKSGNLSKSKRVMSLPGIVIKAIKNHHNGSVPKEFKDLISSQFEKIEDKGSPFVERIEIRHTMQQLINFEETIYKKVEELAQRDYFPQQPGKYKCEYCDYTQICIAHQRDEDEDFLKSISFS